MKQQTYNKMYLITPMVYEKIKQHLDKSDLISLSNINKPFFNPKIEFHGSNYKDLHTPPYNPIVNTPPTVGGDDKPPQPPILEESYDDFLRTMEDMDWREFENFPPQSTDVSTQTNLPPQSTEIATQTSFPQSTEIATQTSYPQSTEMATQTSYPQSTEMATQTSYPQSTEMATQTIYPLSIDMATQTDQQEPKRKPNLQLSNVTQTSYIPPEPVIPPQFQQPVKKKIIPTKSMSTQTLFSDTQKQPRKRKNPQKIVSQTTQQQPRLSLSRELVPLEASRELVPLNVQTRELVPIEGQNRSLVPVRSVVPVSQRIPSNVFLTPELRRQLMHYQHQGQLVFPGNQPLTFEQGGITRPEYPVARTTRQVVLPESTYYVETPSDEPPGQRERNVEEEIVPAYRLVKKTFKPKKKKKVVTPTHILNRPPEEQAQIYDRINLPPVKKLYPCDICGMFLSSKSNLERHQVRERKKIAEAGALPTTDIPFEEEIGRAHV